MKYAIMYGNPSDGFRIIGPFDDYPTAEYYLETERQRGNMWIMELDAPAASEPEDVPDYLRPLRENES